MLRAALALAVSMALFGIAFVALYLLTYASDAVLWIALFAVTFTVAYQLVEIGPKR